MNYIYNEVIVQIQKYNKTNNPLKTYDTIVNLLIFWQGSAMLIVILAGEAWKDLESENILKLIYLVLFFLFFICFYVFIRLKKFYLKDLIVGNDCEVRVGFKK